MVEKITSDKDSSEKLAGDLSTLKVADENENTEKTDEAASKNGKPVTNGSEDDNDAKTDSKNSGESKEPPKD